MKRSRTTSGRKPVRGPAARDRRTASAVAKARAESSAQRRQRAGRVLTILKAEFPGATTALKHENPFQLLVATILSAQCTDERVNMVTPGLFAHFPTPQHFAALSQDELEKEIRSTGFFRMKAKNIIACSRAIVESHAGKVPEHMEELVLLAGVGRKTANVVLGQAFAITSGIVVDTHVHRVSQRLGFSSGRTPGETEKDLMEIFPRNEWIPVGSVLILHGRRTCGARKPDCPACPIRKLCPSALVYT